jgi:FKBP-type peptidyl-prolyl cis-trans isomerase 2
MVPKKDLMLQLNTPDGQQIPARISEVREDSIIMDLNHPLAGKDLQFDIKVVSVE